MNERNENLMLGVIGSRSYVGSEIKKIFEKDGVTVIGSSSSELDITWPDQVDEWMKNFGGDVVVLVAAYTDVDGAQTPHGAKMAKDVNIDGVTNVAQAAKKYNKHLILISSDFVFPGTDSDPGPYEEDRIKSLIDENIGNYGKSKSRGEIVAQESGCNLTIVRIAYPFGKDDKPKNILNKLQSALVKGYSLYADQMITPTYLPELASVIQQVAEEKIYGILHVACQPPVTPFQIGEQIAEIEGLKKPTPGKLSDVQTASPRPLIGGLKTRKSSMILERPSTNIYVAIREVKGSRS